MLRSGYFGEIALGQKVKIKPAAIKLSARAARVNVVDSLIDPATGTFRVQLEVSSWQII